MNECLHLLQLRMQTREACSFSAEAMPNDAGPYAVFCG